MVMRMQNKGKLGKSSSEGCSGMVGVRRGVTRDAELLRG